MSTTETKTATGVILASDLATRYKLAEAQLALIPPIDEDDAEEWTGLRQHCEEVMLFIERTSAAEERERVLREALEDIATFGLSKRDREVARAALATPAPEQPARTPEMPKAWATSDPEGHMQAYADACADAEQPAPPSAEKAGE